jgi:hypothetical protein
MIFSITTSNRYPLFEDTILSMSKCLLDLDLIKKVLLIDDGSPYGEVEQMSKLLAKTFSGREVHVCHRLRPTGHVHSMRIWYGLLDSDYVFHCEDDWRFVTETTPILQSLSIMQSDASIGQVCLARDAGENPLNDTNGIKYWTYCYRHGTEYASGDQNTWPHFTLNPSIIRVKAITDVGNFEDVPKFEYNYGLRWIKQGYETAFLAPRIALHTGEYQSAYDFNRTRR